MGTPLQTLEEDETDDENIEVEVENPKENNENDDLIYNEIDKVKAGNVDKAHGGLITTVIVFDVKKIKANAHYRGSISDGRTFSTRVVFKDTLNQIVENELLDKIKVVRLDNTEVIKGAVIGVLDFAVIVDGPDSLGEAVFVGEDYYKKLKSRGINSPSKLRGNLFTSYQFKTYL